MGTIVYLTDVRNEPMFGGTVLLKTPQRCGGADKAWDEEETHGEYMEKGSRGFGRHSDAGGDDSRRVGCRNKREWSRRLVRADGLGIHGDRHGGEKYRVDGRRRRRWDQRISVAAFRSDGL